VNNIKNLRIDQVAGCLNICTRSVRRLIAEGQLVCFKARGALRVPESSVQAYIERRIRLQQLETGVIPVTENRPGYSVSDVDK